nr:hypothetical protein Iba_chr02dCG0430 [Ipomoea batatas]
MSDCIVRAERLQAKESMATTYAKVHVHFWDPKPEPINIHEICAKSEIRQQKKEEAAAITSTVLKSEYTEANILLYTSLSNHFLTHTITQKKPTPAVAALLDVVERRGSATLSLSNTRRIRENRAKMAVVNWVITRRDKFNGKDTCYELRGKKW